MIAGGGTTLTMILTGTTLPFELDANLLGITVAAIVFIFIQSMSSNNQMETFKNVNNDPQ
jgi:hypothetical protein